MKTLKNLLIVFMLVSILSGCTMGTSNTSDMIARPENSTAPLQGTWILEKSYDTGGGNQSVPVSAGSRVGTQVGFNGNEAVFGDNYWSNVSYKVKTVNAGEYFLHKYDDALDTFGIADKDVLVVTVSSEDKFLYEFVKAADDRYVVNIENEYYSMVKISDKFSGLPAVTAAKNSAEILEKSADSDSQLRSGLLMGFRVPVTAKEKASGQAPGGYKYVTYWIASVNSVLRPVFSADNVFLPRKDGFWRMWMGEALSTEGIEDIIAAAPVSDPEAARYADESKTSNASDRIEVKTEKSILYVGNDYVCVENTVHNKKPGSSEDYTEKVLGTYPVDNLKSAEGISFADLTGDNGTLAMEGAIADVLGSTVSNALKRGPEDFQDKNFALFRKTGHWFFKGRVSLTGNDALSYVDYNINLIPPPDMVAYDMLHVPWTVVKDAVPEAIDAYTSPNDDIAVVLTPADILVYAIENGALSVKPIGKYPVPAGGSVIMAEWATADYVQNWENAFIKNNDAIGVPSGL